MTALTEESLEAILLDMAHMVNSRGETFVIRPTQLIVPPAIYNRLMWKPPAKKARGIRGRKKALYNRKQPALWKMMRGSV